jgi:ribosomal protein S12 methylthiotransferase
MRGLCEALAKFDVWIRLHYVYPYPHVDEIIPLMAEGKVLPYLDIPFQHASPKILKAMRRPAATENTLKRLLQWRKLVPDITIRSTFIVGFPGETEGDFEELLNFLNNAQLDRVGCFKYSAVDGADANKLDAPLSEEVKQERWERFMELQQSISKKKLAAKIGTEIEAIVDKADTESIVARSTGDAPEIDGQVYVESSRNHKPGDLITVKIVASDEYDLYGIAAD